MPATYEFLHPAPTCKEGSEIFEIFNIQIKDRNQPKHCPHCGELCRRIVSRVNFNEIFPGSTKRESLADHWTKESLKAQSEGFRSKDEIDTAIGLAQERAKQMGQPDKQLIGPVESPYKGDKYLASRDEMQTTNTLAKETIKAAHTGNPDKIRGSREALNQHESSIKEKAKKQLTFEPKHSRTDLQKQIKQAQEARKE